MRLEDLDLGRVREGAHDAALDDLRWLGMDWDGPPAIQSRDLSPYREALDSLARQDLLFRCDRSRAEIRLAASAPHAEDGETRYPPALRPPPPWPRTIDTLQANWRLRVEPGREAVHDQLLGDHVFDPGLEAGDLVVWTRQGVPSYQLAVVVDDARHGITDVVRGDDLLPSAARQQRVARALGLPHARWWHVPLVYDGDGKRLAKRHGAHSLARLRADGVPAQRVIGWCAHSLGLVDTPDPITADALVGLATPDAVRAAIAATRASRVVFAPEMLD